MLSQTRLRSFPVRLPLSLGKIPRSSNPEKGTNHHNRESIFNITA